MRGCDDISQRNCFVADLFQDEQVKDALQRDKYRFLLIFFHRLRARTWFSEKRSQIPILGLDSLLLQAYNPLPLFGNEKWIGLQDLLLEGEKNKVTNNKILGLDSLPRQAYNPPSLSQLRNVSWTKGLAQTFRRCLKKLEAFWKKFAGSGT